MDTHTAVCIEDLSDIAPTRAAAALEKAETLLDDDPAIVVRRIMGGTDYLDPRVHAWLNIADAWSRIALAIKSR